MIEIKDGFLICPKCKGKTKTRVLEETELKKFPLYCSHCKKTTIVNRVRA